jgi:hypothetical protein
MNSIPEAEAARQKATNHARAPGGLSLVIPLKLSVIMPIQRGINTFNALDMITQTKTPERRSHRVEIFPGQMWESTTWLRLVDLVT